MLLHCPQGHGTGGALPPFDMFSYTCIFLFTSRHVFTCMLQCSGKVWHDTLNLGQFGERVCSNSYSLLFQVCMSNRYDPSTKSLNLSALEKDPGTQFELYSICLLILIMCLYVFVCVCVCVTSLSVDLLIKLYLLITVWLVLWYFIFVYCLLLCSFCQIWIKKTSGWHLVSQVWWKTCLMLLKKTYQK